MKALEFTAAQATKMKTRDNGQGDSENENEGRDERGGCPTDALLLPPATPSPVPTLGYQRTDHSHFRPSPETSRFIVSAFLSQQMA